MPPAPGGNPGRTPRLEPPGSTPRSARGHRRARRRPPPAGPQARARRGTLAKRLQTRAEAIRARRPGLIAQYSTAVQISWKASAQRTTRGAEAVARWITLYDSTTPLDARLRRVA